MNTGILLASAGLVITAVLGFDAGEKSTKWAWRDFGDWRLYANAVGIVLAVIGLFMAA